MGLTTRYALDVTGINPDNAVVNESHTLDARPVRVFAPQYGPFYTNNVVVRDVTLTTLLVNGKDYVCSELLQEASLRIGLEICQFIVITNPTISSNVTVSYQTVGGEYVDDVSNVIGMYETLLNDNRLVNWNNIGNKPYQYNPSLHQHLLSDITGFEPVVTALERVRNAILLSDSPVFEAMLAWVNNQIPAKATMADMDAQLPVSKTVTLDMLLYALRIYNFNTLTISPTLKSVTSGVSYRFTINSTNMIDNGVLYWTIRHITTADVDFNGVSGIVNMLNNVGYFNLSIASNLLGNINLSFILELRTNSVTGPVVLSTEAITMNLIPVYTVFDYMLAISAYSPEINMSPLSLYLTNEY